MKGVWVLLAAVALALAVSGVQAVDLRRRLAKATRPKHAQPFTPKPRSSFAMFAKTGVMPGDDYFSQVRVLLETDFSVAPTAPQADARGLAEPEPTMLVEMGTKVQKVQSFCEICILVMQMKERGQPHLCAGLNDQYYVTCVEVLISLLRADKALVYWLKNGCMHMDSSGPEIVRPCPAINVCSWVPNLFSQPPSIVRDGVESLCPKDNKFLPTIPQEYKSLIPKGDD